VPNVNIARKVVPLSETQAQQPQLHEHARLLARLKPWAGYVPKGYLVDFLGALTDATFRAMWGADPAAVGGQHVETAIPTFATDDESWFEAANWAAAAAEASGRFVMISLGAQFGTQSVGSYLALQQLNPMPCKLVAVEPEPGNFAWMRKHFIDNGIDPDEHWLLQAAVAERNDPVLFPVGASGHGAHNIMATNPASERDIYWRDLMKLGKPEESLRHLLMTNSTGLKRGVVGEGSEPVEIKYISAVTLDDILGPFDFIDYLETDIQSAEEVVLPPAINKLKRKVRRIHIGTHSEAGHRQLRQAFVNDGWTLIFDYEPYATYETELGALSIDDGMLTLRNPSI